MLKTISKRKGVREEGTGEEREKGQRERRKERRHKREFTSLKLGIQPFPKYFPS